MKHLLILILVVGFSSAKLFAQDDEMKKWMDYMTPGKEHKELAKMNGEWTSVNKMWMDPNADPQTMEGTASAEMLLGDRYSQMKNFGTIMGMPYSGISVIGFDNAKKVYVSSYIDNMGTGMMYAEGVYDEKSKCIVFKGKMVDPLTGLDTDYRETINIPDNNTIILIMYNVMNGKEFKSMEIVYKRK